MASTRETRLGRELAGCADVDCVARVVLGALTEMPGIARAGLALVAPGGRQHHFLPSDPERLRSQPEWCLIDAYDDLPLNDCIRTGRPVVLRGPDVAPAYPALARVQAQVRGVCAVPVGREDRLGGLLVYLDAEPDRGVMETLTGLAHVVGEALGSVRPAEEWPPEAVSGQSPPSPGVDVCALPPDETAPSIARHWLAGVLSDLRVAGEVVQAALVCTSELVTNVVIHTGRPSVVSVERDAETFTVRVRHLTDAAPRRLRPAEPAGALEISGRGLDLVEALSLEWGSEEEQGITTVWCRLLLGELADGGG